MAYVGKLATATGSQHPAGGKVIVRCEVALHEQDRFPGVGWCERSPFVNVDTVDGRSGAVGSGDADDHAADQNLLPVRVDRNLGWDQKPFLDLGAGCRIRSLYSGLQRTLRHHRPLAQFDVNVVHVEEAIVEVRRFLAPLGSAGQPRVRTNPETDDEGNGDNLNPSGSKVAPRPPQCPSKRCHGILLPVKVGEVGHTTGRWTIAGDPATG